MKLSLYLTTNIFNVCSYLIKFSFPPKEYFSWTRKYNNHNTAHFYIFSQFIPLFLSKLKLVGIITQNADRMQINFQESSSLEKKVNNLS